MQVYTITQAVVPRKTRGKAAKRAPWMMSAAVHGGGIQIQDAVGDCRKLVVQGFLYDE